eukprot:11020161-Lingulodinium_polyedra.AAC.1
MLRDVAAARMRPRRACAAAQGRAFRVCGAAVGYEHRVPRLDQWSSAVAARRRWARRPRSPAAAPESRG